MDEEVLVNANTESENFQLKRERENLQRQLAIINENKKLKEEVEALQALVSKAYDSRSVTPPPRPPSTNSTGDSGGDGETTGGEEDYSTFSEGEAGSYLQLISLDKDEDGSAVGVVIGHDENGDEIIHNPDSYMEPESKKQRRKKQRRATAAAKAKKAARKKEKMAELKERARQGEEIPELQAVKEKRARRQRKARIYRRMVKEAQSLDFMSQLLDAANLEATKNAALQHLLTQHKNKKLPTAVRPIRGSETKAELMRQLLACSAVKEDVLAFFVLDLGVVVVKFMEWVTLLPRVQPFYAVKCNPDAMVVSTLRHLGAGFDCASKAEIELALAQGITPDKIIFANPVKQPAHLKYALQRGVRMMTFDNAAEVQKIRQYHPRAQLVLRLLPDDSHSKMPFGIKFGASREESKALIRLCRELDMDLMGVSFHVGSGCMDPVAFSEAIGLARWAFDEAKREGFELSLLDIGGGWPGVFDATASEDDSFSFKDVSKVISPLLDELFPPSSNVKIIAEPGRYFVTAAATLAVQVVASRSRVRDAFAFKNENKVSMPGEDGSSSPPKPSASGSSTTKSIKSTNYSSSSNNNNNNNKVKRGKGSSSSIIISNNSNNNSNNNSSNSNNNNNNKININIKENGRSDGVETGEQAEQQQKQEQQPLSQEQEQQNQGGGEMIHESLYYLADGIYGSFNNIVFDHQKPFPCLLKWQAKPDVFNTKPNVSPAELEEEETFRSSLFGPTCDSIDIICKDIQMPKLEVGDWLYFSNMGAYTSAAASDFNGFGISPKYYIMRLAPGNMVPEKK